MIIKLNIETHAYAEENLCDEMLDENLGDDIDSCGIVGDEIVLPIRRKRTATLPLSYTEETTFMALVDTITQLYGWKDSAEDLGIEFAFFSNGIRYWLIDTSANLKESIENCLDPNNSGELAVALYVSADAGTIDNEDGIRYYMNSKEKGKHHEPHVHIESVSSDAEAVIMIKSGKVVGKFPGKLARKARKKVLENQRFFLEQWNTLTDGLSVDIDRFLGIIHY